MQTRTLGSTGLTVSRIGLGLAALGRPGYITLGHGGDLAEGRSVEAMRERASAVLDAAWSGGVRYLDCARSYGRAEEFAAGWLDPARPVAVGSKWGYTYTADWRVDAAVHEVKDLTLPTLERQLAESRALLGGALGLYQIHSATLESGVLDDAAVLDRLAALRAEGLAVGLSVSGPQQAAVIRRALAVERDGAPLFQSVQATWNLLEPSAGAALTEAHAAGLGVIVKEPVANGRLTARTPDLAPGVQRTAQLLGVTPDAVAIGAVLAQPWADVVLSGAASVAQLAENLAAASIDVTADELGVDVEAPGAYWATRAHLAWT